MDGRAVRWRNIEPWKTYAVYYGWGYWSSTVSTNYAMVHPAATMYSDDGCGWVAPWDSCDVHFQANYWGFGWQKNW
jgi:hypothetical protein